MSLSMVDYIPFPDQPHNFSWRFETGDLNHPLEGAVLLAVPLREQRIGSILSNASLVRVHWQTLRLAKLRCQRVCITLTQIRQS